MNGLIITLMVIVAISWIRIIKLEGKIVELEDLLNKAMPCAFKLDKE